MQSVRVKMLHRVVTIQFLRTEERYFSLQGIFFAFESDNDLSEGKIVETYDWAGNLSLVAGITIINHM